MGVSNASPSSKGWYTHNRFGGVSHTVGAGLSHTGMVGLSHTDFVVAGAPFEEMLLKVR